MKRTHIAALLLLAFCAFAPSVGRRTFAYPNGSAAVTMNVDDAIAFKEEWKDQDYYFRGNDGGGFGYSVLFYKLDEKEKAAVAEAARWLEIEPGAQPDSIKPGDPRLAYAFVWMYLKMESLESGESIRKMRDFYVRDVNLAMVSDPDIGKHVFGYTMFGDDMFVQIQIWKAPYTPEDSTRMHEIIASLAKAGEEK